MKQRSKKAAQPEVFATDIEGKPNIGDRAAFQADLDRLRAREKLHTRAGDAIAAVRRRLPMVELDANLALIVPHGPLTLLDAFEGRRQLIAYYFMWNPGRPAAEQCEGCTWVTTPVGELSYLHARDITYAVFCQRPYDESSRYRDFMDWRLPWYSARDSLTQLLVGREIGLFHLVCYLRDGDRVFETYWTKRSGAEAMDYKLRAHRHHRERAPGVVGGLAPRLAATVLQHADCRWCARVATLVGVAGWTPHRPVVTTRGRAP
jgi:hypothetical protein